MTMADGREVCEVVEARLEDIRAFKQEILDRM